MSRPGPLLRVLLVSMLTVVVADQATKTIVRASMTLCPESPAGPCDRVPLAGPIGILRVENGGSALSLAGGEWLATLLVIGAVLLVAQLLLARPSRILAVGVGLQLGGLVANLMDRLAFGAVTDYLHIQFGGPGRGIVANPADAGLIVGGALFAWAMLTVRRSQAGSMFWFRRNTFSGS